MNRILIYYATCTLLLCWLSYLDRQNTFNPSEKPSQLSRYIEHKLESNFRQKSRGIFLLKLVTGLGPSIHYSIKRYIEDLYLYSLITINGLHLYLLLSLFRMRASKKILSVINLIIPTPSLLKSLLQKIIIYKKISSFQLFYFIQAIVGVVSIFQDKIYAFIFTFIFSGYYYLFRSAAKKDQLWHLIFIQLMIAIALNKSFFILGIFISIAIIKVYKKTYPFLLLTLILSFMGRYSWITTSIDIIIEILRNLATLSHTFKIQSCLFLLLVMLLSKIIKMKWPWYLYFLLNSGIAFTPIIHYSK